MNLVAPTIDEQGNKKNILININLTGVDTGLLIEQEQSEMNIHNVQINDENSAALILGQLFTGFNMTFDVEKMLIVNGIEIQNSTVSEEIGALEEICSVVIPAI